MEDRSLALRFLAFYEWKHEKASSGLKAFLNDFFEEYRNPTEKKLSEFSDKFKAAMRACKTVFGNHAFRLRKRDSLGSGEWASRPNASIFQVISTSFAKYSANDLTRRSDSIMEEYLELMEDPRWVDAVTKSTGDLGNIKYAFEEWGKRLDSVMETRGLHENRERLFSREIKQELYDQNSTCVICDQQITLINDAAVDHIEEYWRGGKTIPSNARLVHRSCNLSRRRA